MNLYIDTSALIKLFVQETYSDEIRQLLENTALIATGLITRAETAAGINRLARLKFLDESQRATALNDFRQKWDDFHRIPISEQLVAHADLLTSQYLLRGYDAIHLACALTWQDLLNANVILATFDKELHEAAEKSGLQVFP
jgi:predicted nucleic acid-binding protein